MKRLSPSKLAYQEACPRYKDTPGTNEAAERGTAMHKAMETGSKIGLEPDEQDAVVLCELYVADLLAKPTVKSVHREVRLRAMQLSKQVVEGTADLVIVHTDNSMDVVDYKFGLGDIEDAQTNLQGQTYALGALRKFKCPCVRVHFLMPRQGDISTATFYPSDIDGIRLRLLTLAAMLRKRRRPYIPNDKSCKWCGNKNSCPGLAKLAISTVPERLKANLPVPSITCMDQPLTPEIRAQLQDIAVILDSWTTEVKKANAQYLRDNPDFEIPGYKLVSRRGSRSLLDSVMVSDYLKQKGIPVDRILAESTLKVTGVESILKDYTPDTEDPEEFVTQSMLFLEEVGIVQRGANVTYLKKTKNKDT